MSHDQRETRMRGLQRRERRDDLNEWLEDFLAEATRHHDQMAPVQANDIQGWIGRFVGSHPLAVFLDFDGTLTPIVSHPSMVKLSDSMREVLSACAERKDTDVMIVSGRSLRDVRRHVALDGLVFAGNHGLEIQGPGITSYRHPDIDHYAERAVELARQLEEIRETGVWVEAKGASLTLHFREADAESHERLAEAARRLVRNAGFQARDALCAVEARPPIGWDKGHAVLHVLREKYGPGWSESLRAIYAGDDETDEDAFRGLRGLGETFRVGPATQPTRARRRLSDVDAVETLLRWIANRAPGKPIDHALSRAG
jgi:trehalose 6-phosphate synthase/phosphatase